MKILSNLFNRDKELVELRAMLTTLSKEHAKLGASVDLLKEDVKELKEVNERLISGILRASDFNAMKSTVRLSRINLIPSFRSDTPPRRP